MKLQNILIWNWDLDKTIAVIGITISTVLIINLTLNHRFLYLFAIIFTLASCVIWIFIREDAYLGRIKIQSSSTNFIFLNILFFIFTTITILSIYLRPNLYERPLIFFIFISIISGIVALEIVFSTEKQKHSCLILFQIIIIGLICAFSQMMIFPKLVGVDPWIHQSFLLDIIETFHIPGDFVYSNFPVFHLIIAFTSLLTDLNYKLSTMFSITLVQIVLNAIFIFLLGKFVLDNQKVGLLGSLLATTGNYSILRAYWSIPNSLAMTFIPIILYLLFKSRKDSSVTSTFIYLIIMIILILTHTITSLALLIILFSTYIGFKINDVIFHKSSAPISFTTVAFFSTFLLGWWTYVSGNLVILAKMIKNSFEADIVMSVNVLNYYNEVPFVEHLMHYLVDFLFFAISIIGLFYMISKKGNQFSFTIAAIGTSMLAISFLGPLLDRAIIPDRWRYISQILLSIPAAVAILLLYTEKNKNIRAMSIFLVILSLTFLMTMSSWSNQDNHFLNPNTGYRFAPIESELKSLQTISSMWNETIGTDQYYAVMSHIGYNMTDISDQLDNKDFTKSENMLILIREEIINKPFWMKRATYKLDYDPKQMLKIQGYSKVYSSNSVSGYKYINNV